MDDQLTFYWFFYAGIDRYEPRCDGGDRPLAHLLGDDGGLDLKCAIDDARHGMSTLEAVIAGESSSGAWDRYHFSADFNAATTRIYWAFSDDKWSETIDTELFRSCLHSWVEFIERGPLIDGVSVIDVE